MALLTPLDSRLRQGLPSGTPRLRVYDRDLAAFYPLLGPFYGLDISGEKNHGTPDTVQSLRATEQGYIPRFNGDADAIRLGSISSSHPLSLYNVGQASFSFWAYRESGHDDFPRILDKSDGGNAQNGYGIWYNQTSGNMQLLVGTNANSVWYTDPGTGAWHHHVIINRANEVANNEGWVDGVSQTLGLNTERSFPSTTTNACIGSWNHSTAREWKGYICNLRVYRRALKPYEIQRLYRDPWWDCRKSEPYRISVDPVIGSTTGAAMYRHLQNLGAY